MENKNENCFQYRNITLYEKTKIIGARAEQIANNSAPFVNIGSLTDPILIATKEYDEGVIPVCIYRKYNGTEIKISFVKK